MPPTRSVAEVPNTGVLEPMVVAKVPRAVCSTLAGPDTGVAQLAVTLPLLLPLLPPLLLLELLLLPPLLLLELELVPPLLLLLELVLLAEPPELPQAASAAQTPSSRPSAALRSPRRILYTMISPNWPSVVAVNLR
jgi:hypothetical protein